MLGKSLSKIDRQIWMQIVFLLGFCFVFYFLALDRPELRKPDEIRYAQVAREIVDGGDWITMHLHGRPYLDKPPLFFWFIALSSYLWQGITPFSARFPSAFFGTLTVLMVFFIGRILYDSRTGFLSSLILATGFEFARYSTRATIDTTLTFFITTSILCFLQWYKWNEEGSTGQKDVMRLSIYGFYVSMALATLSKGPVGFIFPLMASLVFLLIQRNWKGIREMRLLQGLSLFLAVVLCWYLPAAFKGGQTFLRVTLFHQPAAYYLKGWFHAEPIYYYLISFPLNFLPCSAFLPGAMVYGYFKASDQKKEGFLSVFIWFIVIFLFLSFAGAKRDRYLLPLYPAASLLVSKLWGDLIFDQMKRFRREWISIPFYGFVGLAFTVSVVILWMVSKRFPSYLPLTLPVMLFLMVGSLAALFLYRFRRYQVAFYLFVGIMAVGLYYVENFLLHWDKQFKSAPFILSFIKSEFGLLFP